LNVFFDSSALAKRYIEEKGSDQVQAILSSASALAVSVICVPEIVSALCRRRQVGEGQVFSLAGSVFFE
jgi:predicted nucleic acid-binding protein